MKEIGAMDGRLAQSLTPKAGRTAVRAQRTTRGFFGAILALDPPRGLGASCAALLLLASTWYGAIKGGHYDNIVEQVQDICDTAANSAGFRISEVALAGNHELSRENILTLAGVTGRSSLLFLDAARTRARLLSNPWIAEATVLKLYPGRLRIGIVERKPFALWQKDGVMSLIASDGTVLEGFVSPRFESLPLLVGKGAERAGHDFIDLAKRYPDIAGTIDAWVLVAERRWNLHLKGGLEVLLPEEQPERALGTLAELDRTKQLLSRDIVTVDLRSSDRVIVRLSDAAAAARDEAFKAAADRKKKHGKGGEA
jgi:cell division protein FtsQ